MNELATLQELKNLCKQWFSLAKQADISNPEVEDKIKKVLFLATKAVDIAEGNTGNSPQKEEALNSKPIVEPSLISNLEPILPIKTTPENSPNSNPEEELENIPAPPPEPAKPSISAGVGYRGKNKPEDILVIQKLLNTYNGYTIAETGKYSSDLEHLIRKFQMKRAGIAEAGADATVDVHGYTWRALINRKEYPANSIKPLPKFSRNFG